jgi:hypothetical protein
VLMCATVILAVDLCKWIYNFVCVGGGWWMYSLVILWLRKIIIKPLVRNIGIYWCQTRWKNRSISLA